MGEIQIPFGTISSAAADLADPENDLVNYFISIDTRPIAAVIASSSALAAQKVMGFRWFSLAFSKSKKSLSRIAF